MLSQSRDERRRLDMERGSEQQQNMMHQQHQPHQQQPQQPQQQPVHLGGTVPAVYASSRDEKQRQVQWSQNQLRNQQHIYEELEVDFAGQGGRSGTGNGGGGNRRGQEAPPPPMNGDNGRDEEPRYRNNRRRPTAASTTTDPRKSFLRGQYGQHCQHPQPPRAQQAKYHPSNAHEALLAAHQARQQMQAQQRTESGRRPSLATPAYYPTQVAQQLHQQQHTQHTRMQQQHEGVQQHEAVQGSSGMGSAPQYRHQPHPYQYQQQAPRFHSLGTAQQSLTQFQTRGSMPQASSTTHRSQVQKQQQQQQRGRRGPDIDSLVIYGQDNDDNSSQNSGLSQQRLLKKRHGHKLGGSSNSPAKEGKKNYPRRNPNKQNITIVGTPDSFLASSSNTSSSPAAASKAGGQRAGNESAYERRLARERMRGLVRIGSSRKSKSTQMFRYDGVESVDGESQFSRDGNNNAANGGVGMKHHLQQQAFSTNNFDGESSRASTIGSASAEVQRHLSSSSSPLQQQQRRWWDEVKTDEEVERQRQRQQEQYEQPRQFAQPPQMPYQSQAPRDHRQQQQQHIPQQYQQAQYQQQQQQQQQQQEQQRRPIPRSDESAEGHDGRGGYDFGSFPVPHTPASVDGSDELFEDHGDPNDKGQKMRGYGDDAFLLTAASMDDFGEYDASSMELNEAGHSAGNDADKVPIVARQRAEKRPYLPHASLPNRMMEPIFEEEGPIRVGEMERGQSAYPPKSTPPQDWRNSNGQRLAEASPIHASGENLFNQYSINPTPHVPYRRNVGEGGGPSPRLGVPPAPTSYYDRPDPHDPALNTFDGQYGQRQQNGDDPNIIVGQWDSRTSKKDDQDDAWDVQKSFPNDKYAAAAAAAAAAVSGESGESPTSVTNPPPSPSASTYHATNRQTGEDSELEKEYEDPPAPLRSLTPNSILTDEMSNNMVPTSQSQPSDEVSRVVTPRASPQASESTGQGTAIDSTAAVAPNPLQSQRDVERRERIEKAHAIRQRRLQEAREHGVDLLRSSPPKSTESSFNSGNEPLSPAVEIGGPLSPIQPTSSDADGESDGGKVEAAMVVTPDKQGPVQESGSPAGGSAPHSDWEPDEKLPTKRDRLKGRASEDLKGRVIDLSAPSRSEKKAAPRVVYHNAQFGFIEAVAAVVIQTFIRRYLAYKAATIRYEAALTVKDFVISSTQARREAREMQEAMEEVKAVEAPQMKAVEEPSQMDQARELAKARAPMWKSSKKVLSENDKAAMQIQTAFRGWWVRDCLSVDNYCATLIQQAVRGYLRRMAYEFDFYRIVIVQSAVRRYLAQREARKARGIKCAKPNEPTSAFSHVPAQHSNVQPRPEAKTKSFVKNTPVVMENGGKGSLIQAWKDREAQATQMAGKPKVVYQNTKIVHQKTVETKTVHQKTIEIRASEAQVEVQPKSTREEEEADSGRQVEVQPKAPREEEVDDGRDIAATRIQAHWRGYAAQTKYINSISSILMVQSLARRWVTMRLVVPYMLAARSGEFSYDDEYYDDEEYYRYEDDGYGEMDEPEVAHEMPAEEQPQVIESDSKASTSASMVQAWKDREAKSMTLTKEESAERPNPKIDIGGGGGNSLLNAWKEREKQAIDLTRKKGYT